jgi:ParB/RepB/Spo0J family partition protein
MKTQIEQKTIKLVDITPSKTNPRKIFDATDMNELIDSVREKGVIQPILLRPKNGKYELVCGERRYRAALAVATAIKERDEIPAVIRELSDDEVLELQIIENLQRKDVHPMEEAFGFKQILESKKFDVKELAKRIGKGSTYVIQRLKLNDLIDEFQKACYANRLNLVNAYKICTISAIDQKELWKDDFKDEKGTIEINNWTMKKYICSLHTAPFDIKDPNLKKDMGSCISCPHNTASNTSLFPEAASVAKCMNSQCFKQKCNLLFDVQLKAAIEDPTVQFVSKSHSTDSKIYKQLVKEGKVILQGSNAYSTADKPIYPDMEEFEENLEDGDYETRDEMMADFNKEVAAYNKDMEKYEADIAKGKYSKAFVIEGDEAGTFIYITMAKKAGGKSKALATGTKAEAAATPTKADLKAEIERIKAAGERKDEIEGQKIMPLYYALLEDDLKFVSDAVLTENEKRAALIALIDKTIRSYDDEEQLVIYKLLGAPKLADDDFDLLKTYDYLVSKKHGDLNDYLNIMLRVFLRQELKPKGLPTPTSHGQSKVLIDVVKQHYAIDANKILENFTSERGKRQHRIKERIEKLDEQINPKKNPLKKELTATSNVKKEGDLIKKLLKPTPDKKKSAKKAAKKKPAVKKAKSKKSKK